MYEDIIPRMDTLQALALDFARQLGARMDDSLATIWAEHLRSISAKVLEAVYPDLPVAAGQVLPVMTDMDPADEEHVYYSLLDGGYADWIGDDGKLAPSSWITAARHVGYAAEMAHAYDLNFFDLEKAARARANGAKVSVDAIKGKRARRAHEEFTDWTWSFGDSAKRLLGLFNHPNISVTVAPLNAAANSRLPVNKSDDEIAADFDELIDRIPNQTLSQHYTATVFLSAKLVQNLRSRRLGAGDGFASLWDLIKNRFSGDDTGQGKVTFKVMNVCDPTRRRHPKYNDDRSGIAGEFMFAMASLDTDEAHFKRARPFTTRPPQLDGVNTHFLTHSKIGGAVLKRPLAFHRFDFGTV